MADYKILAINPGSTSIKIAVFKNENLLYQKTLIHSSKEIKQYKKISDGFQFRKNMTYKTYPGEDEMVALAQGVLRVLKEEEALNYEEKVLSY